MCPGIIKNQAGHILHTECHRKRLCSIGKELKTTRIESHTFCFADHHVLSSPFPAQKLPSVQLFPLFACCHHFFNRHDFLWVFRE